MLNLVRDLDALALQGVGVDLGEQLRFSGKFAEPTTTEPVAAGASGLAEELDVAAAAAAAAARGDGEAGEAAATPTAAVLICSARRRGRTRAVKWYA